jgi:hypothetical protein
METKDRRTRTCASPDSRSGAGLVDTADCTRPRHDCNDFSSRERKQKSATSQHGHPTGELFAYWEGQLDEAARAAVEAHASRCPECLRGLLEIGDLVLGEQAGR